MSLSEILIEPDQQTLPEEVARLIASATARIDQFVEARLANPIVAYVPCDFAQVYAGLVEIDRRQLAPGPRFMEWGCGVGTVTCLAAMLGMDAIGVEIEPDLVAESAELACEHDCDAQFVAASFLPAGTEDLADRQADIAWLRSDGADAYELLDLEPDDIDLVFAYPWPGEEYLLFDVFARCAANGALLLTFHGQDGLRLHRNLSR